MDQAMSLATPALLAARIQELEDDLFLKHEDLEDAYNLAWFLYGCLTDPSVYNHAYPDMSKETLQRLRGRMPPEVICVHSKTVLGCLGCEDRNYKFKRRREIEKRRGDAGPSSSEQCGSAQA